VENVAPLFRRLARRESVEVFDSSLNTTWATTPARPSGIVALRKAVRCLDEANAEDSKTPKYYAMIALSVLDDAFEAHQQVRPLPAAESAATGAINLWSNFDVILRSEGPRRLIGGRMPPPGPLEQAQWSAQRESVVCLRDAVRTAGGEGWGGTRPQPRRCR
jgi:hypothetical protein